MKAIALLPLVGSLTACGYMYSGIDDYRTIYSTQGCCNSVVVSKPCCKQVIVKPVIVKPVVTRPCYAKVISRPIANPCCSSAVTTSAYYDNYTVVNTEPVDVTTVNYDYY